MLKRGWMAFADGLARVQTVVLLSVVYVIVIGPLWVALCALGRRDLLEMRRLPGNSFAHTKQQIPTDRARCERQF